MGQRWTQFADEQLQSLLFRKAGERGAAFRLGADGRIWFDDEEWCRAGDPHILALDELFGPEWVAVYANEPGQRGERTRYLSERGIRFVVWFDKQGTTLVLDRQACPAGWDYA
jgi:hypothetical protein